MWPSIGLFLGAAVIIGVVGPRLSRAAEHLATVTGLGQTLAGALFLGGSTSLPGLIVSFKTAFAGQANLAVTNSVGGIAAQTLFIALADVAYRESELEYKNTLAASLMQSAVLISLLVLALLAMIAPEVSYWGIHPISPIIAVGVVVGFRIIQGARQHPRWQPIDAETQNGTGGKYDSRESERTKPPSARVVYFRYVVYLLLVGGGGWMISQSGSNLLNQSGFSAVIMGGTFMALATSLPELVTAVSAVRRGAVTLAIGDIVGGNAFDTIMLAIGDFAYREGSIYRAAAGSAVFLTATATLMTGVLLVGFLRREEKGMANVGVESYLLVGIYGASVLVVLLGRGAFKP